MFSMTRSLCLENRLPNYFKSKMIRQPCGGEFMRSNACGTTLGEACAKARPFFRVVPYALILSAIPVVLPPVWTAHFLWMAAAAAVLTWKCVDALESAYRRTLSPAPAPCTAVVLGAGVPPFQRQSLLSRVGFPLKNPADSWIF